MWALRWMERIPRAASAIALLLVLLVAGCGAQASSPAADPQSTAGAVTPGLDDQSLPAAVATPPPPTPVPPLTPAASMSSRDGNVVHVNVAVPLARQAPQGSACGAADLRETGPKAATVPGAPFAFYDFERVRELGALDDATQLEQTSVGHQTVPDAGVVAEPIADDPDFPAACVFSFDVVTGEVELAYMFAIGPPLTDDSIYFPIPAILRTDLEAAGWVANIGVNPQ